MSNLFVRIISGLVYGGIIIGSCYSAEPGIFFLACFLGFPAIVEWLQFRKGKNISLQSSMLIGVYLLSLLLYGNIIDLSPIPQYTFQVLIFIFLVSLFTSMAFSRKREIPLDLFHSTFTFIYIIVPLHLLVRIPFLTDSYEPLLLLSIFIIIWCNDSFAYFSGRLLGKHKLFERVSPNKTWEGFIGGLVFSLAAAYIMSLYFPFLGMGKWLGLAAVVIIFATVGDLFESSLKRAYKLKDSGRFMPGHGGILDRIDSLLFALPAAYLYLQALQNY